jgi:hypothetical protein
VRGRRAACRLQVTVQLEVNDGRRERDGECEAEVFREGAVDAPEESG